MPHGSLSISTYRKRREEREPGYLAEYNKQQLARYYARKAEAKK